MLSSENINQISKTQAKCNIAIEALYEFRNSPICSVDVAKTSLKECLPDLDNEFETSCCKLVDACSCLLRIISARNNSVRASLAIETILSIMPSWALAFGKDYFNDMPEDLLSELEKLDDQSWSKDPLPMFIFGKDESQRSIYLWFGYVNDTFGERLLFSMKLMQDNDLLFDLDTQEFLMSVGLPSCNWSRDEVSTSDINKIVSFLRKYATPTMNSDLKNRIFEHFDVEELAN